MTITKLKLLKNNLIRNGVSHKHASRYVRELEHHYDDLFVEAKYSGLILRQVLRKAQWVGHSVMA